MKCGPHVSCPPRDVINCGDPMIFHLVPSQVRISICAVLWFVIDISNPNLLYVINVFFQNELVTELHFTDYKRGKWWWDVSGFIGRLPNARIYCVTFSICAMQIIIIKTVIYYISCHITV